MRPRSKRQLFLALLIAMVPLVLLRFRLESEADLGFHLAQGRLLASGVWMRTSMLSWTSSQEPWTDVSWLFDLSAFGSAKLFGAPLGPKLLLAAIFALTLLFLGLLALELSERGVWMLPLLGLLLLVKAMPRPHTASWIVLACVLWICWRARGNADRSAARRLRFFALLPIWLGAQLHPGALFSAAPLGLFCLEAALQTRTPRALCPALLAPVAYVLGPAGFASLGYLLLHLRVGEVVPLLEFQPWKFAYEPALPFLVAASLLGIVWEGGHRSSYAGPRWQRLAAPIACVLLFAFLTLRTVRFFYEGVVVCAPGLLLLGEQLRARLGARPALLAIAAATALCLVPHRLGAELATAELDPRWNQEQLPVRAARFLDEHQLVGHGFNGLADGGYLAWARPGVPIFVDSLIQASPPELWHRFGDAEASPARFDQFLRDEGALWALTERTPETLSGYRLLHAQPGWALIYWDDTSEVYLRRDQPQQAALINSLEYKLFVPWADTLGGIARLAPGPDAQTLLRALDAEVTRFLATCPGDANALAVACASLERQAAPTKAFVCEAAVRAASRPGNDALLRRLQTARGN